MPIPTSQDGNVSNKALLDAFWGAVVGKTWNLNPVPTFYYGPTLEVQETGPILIVTHANQGAERGLTADSGLHEKYIMLIGGLPWESDPPGAPGPNETYRQLMADEIERLIVANRRIAHVTRVLIRAVEWTEETIFGPDTSRYRCVKYTLGCEGRRHPNTPP